MKCFIQAGGIGIESPELDCRSSRGVVHTGQEMLCLLRLLIRSTSSHCFCPVLYYLCFVYYEFYNCNIDHDLVRYILTTCTFLIFACVTFSDMFLSGNAVNFITGHVHRTVYYAK